MQGRVGAVPLRRVVRVLHPSAAERALGGGGLVPVLRVRLRHHSRKCRVRMLSE